jgi:cell division protease FtsH
MADHEYVKNKTAPKKNPTRDRFKPVHDDDGVGFGGGSGDGSPLKRALKFVLFAALFVAGFLLVQRLFSNADTAEPEVTYNEFRRLLDADLIDNGIIEKSEGDANLFRGTLKRYENIELTDAHSKRADRFLVKLPLVDNSLAQELVTKKIRFRIDQHTPNWTDSLMVYGPWIILGLAYFFIFRRMRNAGNGAAKNMFNFGKSRAKLVTEFDTKITFTDVAGVEEAKEELREIVEFLKDPERFERLGGKIPKGVLLLGSPGTGKTLLARAVAGEANVPFFSMSGADFVEMFVGVGASRVRDLFEQAKRNSPCIIFIDEIDAVGRQRGAGLGGGHDEREQTLNQLLVEMDGFAKHENVILIAATNRPDVLDSALLRPGRFDRQVVVDKPDVRGREAILKIHTKNVPLAEGVKLDAIAKGTPGFAGAELANLVNEAALLAARNGHEAVTTRDLEDAKDKVLMGAERKSAIISEKDKLVTSYHESGHVLVAKFTQESDPVHKVTIIPRGRALGLTSYLPTDDKHTYTRKYILAMITYALGGRAAEEVIFGEISTGASNDIERATGLARKMVCEWGMSDKLGPLNYGTKVEDTFLGREINRSREYSEATQVEIDGEIKRIISEAMSNALTILRENMPALHRLAKQLIEKEVLDADEIDSAIRGDGLSVA